ncbi:acyl-CoA thioesterase [Nocardioides dongxiaopingii]|uniref:acyl-CoA thioesterase n=1 Tax=Nocardioides dongxiaopingii TaxID=2576036 RepID=UPI0010C76FCD|nr:thioesterase family protein [Nocardioides dongxiaopingii]
MSRAPSVTDLRALPASYTTEVTADLVDANGHLNVRHHVALHDEAGWAFFADLGFTPERIEEGRHNFFDLEHHVRYLAEARLGERLSVRHRLVARTSKALHLVSYLVNDSTDAVASTLEVVTLMVDLDTRRPVDYTAEEAAVLDTRLAADRALGWDAGLSGVLGLRPARP